MLAWSPWMPTIVATSRLSLSSLSTNSLTAGAGRTLAVARADVIGFNEQLFAGQINHDEIVGVGGWQRIDFDAARAVGQYSRPPPKLSRTKALLLRSRLSGLRVCGACATLA